MENTEIPSDWADCHIGSFSLRSVLTLKNDPVCSPAGIVSSQGNYQPVPVTDV